VSGASRPAVEPDHRHAQARGRRTRPCVDERERVSRDGVEEQVRVIGADRICADGSVVNKIGSYSLAVLAHAHGVPFIVVAPTSTIDLATASGDDVEIEHRAGEEVTSYAGRAVAPAGTIAYNPAFDVTPPRLVTAVVTETGVARPVDAARIAALVASS